MAASTLPRSKRPPTVTQRSSARYRHWPFRCCSSPSAARRAGATACSVRSVVTGSSSRFTPSPRPPTSSETDSAGTPTSAFVLAVHAARAGHRSGKIAVVVSGLLLATVVFSLLGGGAFISARIFRGASGAGQRQDVAKYVIAAGVPGHAGHSEHNADPGSRSPAIWPARSSPRTRRFTAERCCTPSDRHSEPVIAPGSPMGETGDTAGARDQFAALLSSPSTSARIVLTDLSRKVHRERFLCRRTLQTA